MRGSMARELTWLQLPATDQKTCHKMQSGKNFGTKCNRKIQQKIAFLASAAATILETKDPEFIPNMVATTAYIQSHETPIQQTMWFYPTVVGVQNSWRSFTHLPLSAFGSIQRPQRPFFWAEFAQLCQKLPKFVGSFQKVPQGAKVTHNCQKSVKICHGLPEDTK